MIIASVALTKNINWKDIKNQFEQEMASKLARLPGHRKVPENLKAFRSLISHELPETSSFDLFNQLIGILLKGEYTDLEQIKERYLNPELEKEKNILKTYNEQYIEVKQSASEWVSKNLTEEQLKTDWNKHKTWLPRRYTIYENPNLLFQDIAADTLSRYYIINLFGNPT